MKLNSTFLSLVLLNGIKEAFAIILSPILPEQLIHRGVSNALFTPLYMQYLPFNTYIRCFNIAFLFSSLLAGKYQGRIGRKLMLRVGLFLQFIAALLYISMSFIEQVAYFLFLGFFARTLQGIGAGLLQTAAFGGFIGLLISSFLSYAIGFIGPFALCVFQDKLINFVNTPNEKKQIIYFSSISEYLFRTIKIQPVEVFTKSTKISQQIGVYGLNEIFKSSEEKIQSNKLGINQRVIKEMKSRQTSDIEQPIETKSTQEDEQEAQQINSIKDIESGPRAIDILNESFEEKQVAEQQVQIFENVGYSHILFTKRGFFGCVAIALSVHTYTLNDTIIADHLMRVYSLEPWSIALIQSIQSVGFMIMTHFTPKFNKEYNLTLIVVISQLFMAGGALLIGPSQFLTLPDELYITCIGLLISGLSSPFNMITSFSIITTSIDSHIDKKFNPVQVKDLVSALFNSFYAIGGMTGPIFGGYISEHTNFRTVSDAMALFLILIASLQVFIIVVPEKLKKRQLINKVAPINEQEKQGTNKENIQIIENINQQPIS
ncbi:major facilitator superfamily [Stylonychia lemnae]|uniref:Major facilitator superfamily n=1 Tax=Stylonychia lemnae TaxID=5949 RepID=A0A078B0L7_STYLE|nr:major facilitator superfamily [Stylonychia lemnae]|eukprot:CDW88200.1 major facilitator superfamily [Stylonychia lemnae]